MVAKFNLDYYDINVEGMYTDGSIEEELLKYAADKRTDWYEDGRWPVVYHMSHLRHNILNWFPFNENSSILEIGSGCGALTGMLCEKAESVVSIELTKKRAMVNYERHKHIENLEIIVADIQVVPQEKRFDYVIINGVLEYAAFMFNGEYPYQELLKVAKNHLKDTGKILLSIENRIGFKYFSGAKEDHTGDYFSGINDYSKQEKVRTFSKSELNEEIKAAGLFAKKYFYPYPDYKFPFEIFTDESVNSRMPIATNYALDMTRVKLFDEKVFYGTLAKEGLAGVFANSFLVEIVKDETTSASSLSYIKISNNRKPEFRIATYFDTDSGRVYKKPLSQSAKAHLQKMKKFESFDYHSSLIENVASRIETEDRLSFPFLEGETLENHLISLLLLGEKSKFENIIIKLRDTLFTNSILKEQEYSQAFSAVFGDEICCQKLHWRENSNIDMISGNIFLVDNKQYVIDYEWHMPCEVPQEFILWRFLVQFSNDHDFEWNLKNEEIINLIGIDTKTAEKFGFWEIHFSEQYVGIKDMRLLENDTINIDLEKAASQQMRENTIISTLFFDFGDGFQETYHIQQKASYINRIFEVEFKTEDFKKAGLLRWDPIEGYASSIKIHKVDTDGCVNEIRPLNAEEGITDQKYTFYTYDPQFILEGDFSQASYVKIYFECEILEWTQGYHTRIIELEDAKNKIKKLDFVERQFHAVNKEVETQKQLRLIKEEELKKSLEQIENLKNEMIVVDSKLKKSEEEIEQIQAAIKNHKIKSGVKILIYGNLGGKKKNE